MKLNVHLRCNSNFLKVFLSQWVSVNFLRANRPDFFYPAIFLPMKVLLIYINAAMKATYTKEKFTGSDEFLTASIAYTLQA